MEAEQIIMRVHDNPHYIEENIAALQMELRKDNPDVGYLKEKTRHINEWIDEIAKFHKVMRFTPYGMNVYSVIREVKK